MGEGRAGQGQGDSEEADAGSRQELRVDRARVTGALTGDPCLASTCYPVVEIPRGRVGTGTVTRVDKALAEAFLGMEGCAKVVGPIKSLSLVS